MMDDIAPEDAAETRKGYYAEARSWSTDKVEELVRSRRTAWLIVGAVVCVAVAEAFALIAMLPLKTVVPYTILVDRNTGFVQTLESDEIPSIKPESALTQSLLAQYVVARETFDISSIQAQYRKVALFSIGDAKRDYLAIMPASNPDSPVNRYGRATTVETHIESVTPIAPDRALLRFFTEQHKGGQPIGKRAYWVSHIRYRFAGEPMSIEDRLINPLGFQVVRYRRDQEAPPVPELAGAAAPALGEVPYQMDATPNEIQSASANETDSAMLP